MVDIDITQDEADRLIEMEKHCLDEQELSFPEPGGRLSVPLSSPDKRELFALDITRSQIKLTKATYQNRARQALILMRLDLNGPIHRNPDGQEIPCPHLHRYREGFGDKWAIPAPHEIYGGNRTIFELFEAFMQHCNITQVPKFQPGLF